jgi:ribose transport system ATP-binding protein
MIEFSHIEKSFFDVKVLKDVTFTVKAGQTLGIVGENGAGKSTLMNILGGNLRADAGQMRLNSQRYTPTSPRDATRAGIAFIHQELNLFANLSIAENIFIRGFPRQVPWLPFIHRRQIHERTRELLREVNLTHPPDTLIERLSAGERQLVEIAKLIIFDEPTTSLTARETERLFAIMARLRARGISMIYISHSLGHVLKLCDELVVLRDGAVVANEPTAQFTMDRLVSLMVGRELTQLFPLRVGRPTEHVVLDVRGLAQPGVARDISFQVRQGEIVGLSGLMGAGRSELARMLFGLDPCAQGDIQLAGQPIGHLPPGERIRRGLAFLTEDRRVEGLCLEASIADNVTLVALDKFRRGAVGWIDQLTAAAAVKDSRHAVRLTPAARDEQPVKTLSGGNQQKVVLAKWLLNEPKLFILDEPTRGIDVGAKYEVYRLIQDFAARGAGVLLISSEVEELIGMCDRILVMRGGGIRDTIEPHQFDRERILRAAIHDGVLT